MKTIITGIMRSGTQFVANHVYAEAYADKDLTFPTLHEPFNVTWQGGNEHPNWNGDTRASMECGESIRGRHSGHNGELDDLRENGGVVATKALSIAQAVADQYGACEVWRVLAFHWWKALSVVNDGVKVLYVERSPAGWLSSAARTVVPDSQLPLLLPTIVDTIAHEDGWPGHASWCDLGRLWAFEAHPDDEDERHRLTPLYIAAAYQAIEAEWQWDVLASELDPERGDDLLFVNYDLLLSSPEVQWPRVAEFLKVDDFSLPDPVDTAGVIADRTFLASTWSASDIHTVSDRVGEFLSSNEWELVGGDDEEASE